MHKIDLYNEYINPLENCHHAFWRIQRIGNQKYKLFKGKGIQVLGLVGNHLASTLCGWDLSLLFIRLNGRHEVPVQRIVLARDLSVLNQPPSGSETRSSCSLSQRCMNQIQHSYRCSLPGTYIIHRNVIFRASLDELLLLTNRRD